MTVAQRAYERFEPYHAVDAQHGHALRAFFRGLMAPLEICDVARDTDTHIAWGTVLDPVVCPSTLLPWLGQIAGVQFVKGESETLQRDRLKKQSHFYRGTVEAIRAQMRPTLTGNQTVHVLERTTNEWTVTIVTRATETPDPQAAERAGRTQIAPWLLATFFVSDEPIIDEGGETRTIDTVGSAGTSIDATTILDWS